MRGAPTRPATSLLLLALLVPLAACSSAARPISTSAGAPVSSGRSPTASPGSPPGTAAPAGTARAGTGPAGTGPTGTGPTGTAAAAATAPAAFGGSAAAAEAPAHRGSVTVRVVRPVAATGTADAAVSCVATASGVYVALVSKAVAGGYDNSFTLRISGFHGAGSYRAVLSASVSGPRGAVASLKAVAGIPAVITRAGGTFTVNTTGTTGHTLAATVAWTCP